MRRILATFAAAMLIWATCGLPVAFAAPHHGAHHGVHPDGAMVSDWVW
ncbi:MAG: hypothetical protein IRZ11_02850 [Clostridia bacterium]|nr:hypothetical protein [Clostridia bacterium]